MPLPNHELYLGVDYGEVSGDGSEYLIGNRLAGGVLGLRGEVLNMQYDLFAGILILKPNGFETSPVVLGFNVDWRY